MRKSAKEQKGKKEMREKEGGRGRQAGVPQDYNTLAKPQQT